MGQLRRSKLWIFLAVIVFVLLACGGSTPGAGPQQSNGSDAPTATEEEVPVGTTRSNPAPYGESLTTSDMTFRIVDIIRPADSIIEQANIFNNDPEAGEEYILIQLAITCKKDEDETCSLFMRYFDLVGSSGLVREPKLVLGVDDMLETSELYGGATQTGYTAFILDIGETDLVLAYEPLFEAHIFLSAGE